MCGLSAVSFRELHGPRKVAGFAVATARKETADASEGVAEREAGRQRVEGRPKRHFRFQCEQPNRECRAEERPVKNHAGALHEQVLKRVITPVIDDVQDLGTSDASDEHPEHKVRDVLGIESDAHAAPAGRPKADHEAGGQQNAVPMDCDAA